MAGGGSSPTGAIGSDDSFTFGGRPWTGGMRGKEGAAAMGGTHLKGSDGNRERGGSGVGVGVEEGEGRRGGLARRLAAWEG
jgi:hypothetical protein